jgi:hypothetical protein
MNERAFIPRSLQKCFPGLLLLFASFHSFAHDSFEITLTARLYTNRIELRAVMLRKTIQHVAESQGVHLLDFSIPSEREEAMPILRSQAAGLFALACGTNMIRASKIEVALAEEDHVGFNLIYPITNVLECAAMKLDAKLLAHLPTDDPYAVSVIVLDLENNQVRGEKILNTKSPSMELTLPRPITQPKQEPIP